MIKKLRYLCTLLLIAVASAAWGDGSITFADLGLENGVQYTDPFDGGDFTVTFAGGTNDGKYYTTGSGIRVYGGGSMTIAAKSGNITALTITYDGTNKPTTQDVVNTGTYNVSEGTWTGKAASVVFTRPSGSGHWRIQKIEVTIESGTVVTKSDAVLTFNPTKLTLTAGETKVVSFESVTDGVITFSSTNENVATYDEITKTVTAVGEGSATIKAVSAETDNYYAGNASIMVTVEPAPLSEVELPYEESFAANKGSFTIDNVSLAEGLEYVWSHDSSNKYMKASSYKGENLDAESWLVSPVIDATSATQGVKFIFSQCINKYFGTIGNEATVWAKEEGGNWEKLTITYPTIEESKNWSSMVEQEVDLSAYAGKKFKVAFKYVGTSVAAGTWEIKGIKVEAKTNVPSIIADDVELAYNATSGDITYTIDNPVDGVVLTADTDADWISNISVTADKISFTTTTNEGTEDRLASFTLSYEGAEDKIVSVTQKHLVIDYATLPFAYDGNGSGTLPLGLTQNGVGTYNTSPAMKFDGTGDWLILKFNEQPGKLTFDIKGNSFSDGTFKVQTSEDGLTYTDLKTYTVLGSTQNEEFNNLGENVRYIKWIYTEKVNGNVALGNIRLEKPGQVSPPVISANNVTIAADATSGEISYSIANPDDGVGLTATTDVDWISNIVVSAEKITFSTTANTGDADRTATFILKYEGAESKEVTVTQKHVVADIAGLPFEFDGGKADIANTAGLTYDGLDSDYGSSPKLKFNSTEDYLLLHFNEQPGKLTFAIKGNSFSGGTFKVQTSADGELFTDLGTYTTLNETTQSEEFINLSADARYIKWIYTEKVSGNVALGLIKLEKPSNDPIITAEDVTIEANATSGEIAYTITNPIEGTTLSASTDTEWISDVAVSANKVSFITTENTGAERTGVIKLTYGSVTKEVTVKQKRSVISGNVRYELVNSTDGLTDGQYLIVSSLGEFAVAFDGSLETLDAVGNNKLVTMTDNVIMATDAISFTITAKDGGYSIKSFSGLYIGNTSDANILKTSPSDDYVNAISFDEDGNADVVSAETYLRYNATSNQDRFRYFKSSSYANQEAIQLFKKVSSTETLLGDVNDDKKVDVADVTALVNALKEGKEPTEGNIDGENGVNAEDVRALVEMILSNSNQ